MADSARYSVPGKVFILGEYAVLAGAPALLLTLSPRFLLDSSGARGRALREIPEQAPVRKLLQSQSESILNLCFHDPHAGVGGFGGSTAEFALAYAAVFGASVPVKKLWTEYRAWVPNASGADLAAQWVGGAVIVDAERKSVSQLPVTCAETLFSRCFVFSAAHQAGRKVKTHEHLEAVKKVDLRLLAQSQVLQEGIAAANAGNFKKLAAALNEYAWVLRNFGLELAQTTADREAFLEVPGVIAVKGTGAMQADALVVLVDDSIDLAPIRSQLEAVARSRDLRLISEGWRAEAGILQEVQP